MRPTGAANEAAFPPARSRKSSIAGDRRPSINSTQPTSFFLAKEEDIYKSNSSRRGSASHRPESSGRSEPRPQADSTFGVQSLEDALGEAFGTAVASNTPAEESPKAASPVTGLASLLKRKRPMTNDAATLAGAPDDTSSKQQSPPRPSTTSLPTLATPQRTSRTNTVSQPLTPLQLESPFPESAMPSTPKSGSFRSLRLSDGEEDEAASQAITSGGEEEDDEIAAGEEAASGSFMAPPQLVMPSLAMPSRRPFTERGKQMGRLKIAVAGADGVGKTSLIRAIVRQCEDIVHLDPITTQPTSVMQSPQPGKKPRRPQHITEVQASTKAYPSWWSDMEDSRVLRRRKSMSETVLERNISFIDSPGFATKSELNPDRLPLIAHLEQLFQRNSAMPELGSSELLNILSGAGGVQVDVVLYICAPAESITQHDFAYMTKLSKYATVIPIISKSDTSPETELSRRKEAIAPELTRLNINPTVLSKARLEPAFPEQTPMPQEPSSSSYLGSAIPQSPFLVSALPGSDDGEMDASLLMSPSYSPPLVASELQALVSMLFDPEIMQKLRHISARKFLQWREHVGSDATRDLALITSAPATGMGIKDHLALARRNTSPARRSPFNLASSSASVGIGNGLSDFSRARVRDHIAREERLAQVQLAKWAADLQRSLRREREEYARLAEGERAKWLLKQVGEEATAGRFSPSSSHGSGSFFEQQKRIAGEDGPRVPRWARARGEDKSDPLGLCGFADGVVRTGGLVLKALGGGVIVGAVWMVVLRAWGGERWVGWFGGGGEGGWW